MKLVRAAILAAIVGVPLMSFAQGDPAVDEHVIVVGNLTIEHGWARAASAGDETLVFLEIENAGPADMLMGASSNIAANTTLVGLIIDRDAVEMVPTGPVEVPTGVFELDPGGLALALDGLTRDLVEGAEFELTLMFGTAGAVEIHVLVEAADATAHSHSH